MKEILNAKITQTAESEELIDLAKSKGILLPSDNLGAFKTVYARLEDSNRNGVRLATDAVEKALQSLIGAQVNINHWRENWTVGSIFWAKINKNDEIEIAFTFFKDIYSSEYELAMELFDKGELTVSFELTADKEAQEFHADGTRTLHDVHFVGCGLLLNEQPAEPTAIVFESAKRQIKELVSKSTGNLVFAKLEDINFEALKEVIRATLKSDEIEQDEQSQINPEIEGGSKLMDETKKNGALESAEEEIKVETEESSEVESKETSDEAKVDETIEETSQKEVSEEVVEEADEEAEVPEVEDAEESEAKEVEEDVTEEKAETESDEAKVEYKTEVNKVIKETYDEQEQKVEVDSEVTETVEVDGEPSSKVVEKTKQEVVYTYAEVEAMQIAYETKIADLEEALKDKDSEIESAKEIAIKVTKLKAELGDYVADFKEEDFLNEDKIEIARLRKENDALKLNDSKEEMIEEVKAEEVKANLKEKIDLENGHEEIKANDEAISLSDVIKDRMRNSKEV